MIMIPGRREGAPNHTFLIAVIETYSGGGRIPRSSEGTPNHTHIPY